MSHTTFDVPFDACGLEEEDSSVLVFGERVAMRFDREHHETRSVPPKEASPTDDDAVDPVTAELLWHGLREVHARLEDETVVTSLVDVAGMTRATFAGTLRSLAIVGDLYAAVVFRSDESCESIVGRFDGPASVLGTALATSPTASDGTLLAITTETPLAVHVVKAGDHLETGFVRVSLPLVHDCVIAMVVAHGRAYCLSKRALDVAELRDLPFEHGDRSLPACFAPFVPRGTREPLAATVVMTVGQNVLLQHPRLGRLRLVHGDGDPDLEKGDEVVLEDVLEKLPGLFDVRRWHRASGPPSSRPPPPLLASSRPAPVVSPRAL